MCSVLAAPALAAERAPNIHLAISAKGMPVTAHVKSPVRDPKYTNYTVTETFSADISTGSYYKEKILLLGDTWYNSSTCGEPPTEKWTGLPKKTMYAKVGTGTSTGSIGGCTGVTFTFQDIDYTLETKKAVGDEDVVQGDLVAKKWQGYNLKLVTTIDIAITQ